MPWGNAFTYFTCDGCARDGCFGCRSSRFGRNRDAGAKGGDGVDAADDGGGGRGWFGSAYDFIAQTLGFGPTAADPLDECEKGETCQAEPWLGGLWGSKMVLLFVLLNFSDGLIDDETDAMAALFCCCCVAALSCMTVALGQTISHSC